jgi:outer membrane beta-barrel protein
MRNQYTAVLILLLGLNANAQSEQYKRSKKTTTPSVATPTAPASNNKNKDLKVDIKDLEEQYWTPQDTEFKVVQNRKFSKDGKFAFSFQFGPLMNDSYADGMGNLGLTLGYYFSEFMGVEINYTKYNTDESEVISAFQDQYGGVTPDYNEPVDYMGASFNWIPIYGKMSIQDKKIIYFDLAISPGIGMTKYQQLTAPTAATPGSEETAFVMALDFSQHFFFSENWAARIDMKNRRFKEDIVQYTSGNAARDGDKTTTLWQVGLTYYFSAPAALNRLMGVKPKTEEGGQ